MEPYKINGGLIVDYIETDDAGEAGDVDKASVQKLIDRSIRSNNRRVADFRDNFIFYVKIYNDIRFTYDDKERDCSSHLTLLDSKRYFTNQDWILNNQNIADSYINSKVYTFYFNLVIYLTGITGLIKRRRTAYCSKFLI